MAIMDEKLITIGQATVSDSLKEFVEQYSYVNLLEERGKVSKGHINLSLLAVKEQLSKYEELLSIRHELAALHKEMEERDVNEVYLL